MLLSGLPKSITDERDAGGIERKAHPEELDLVLGGEGDQPGRAEHRRDIDQVVGAAGNHRRGRRGAGRGHHGARVLGLVQQLPQPGVKRDLQPETGAERQNVIPELGKLAHGELPAGDQRKRGEIRGEQQAERKHSEAGGPCASDVSIHDDPFSKSRPQLGAKQ